LKSTIENLTPTRIKVQVEVPFSELKPSLDAAYQKIASQISVPGFRKGKVPTQVIDQRVGRPAVLQEAVNEAIPKAYAEALKDKKVYPIGRPSVEVTELKENEDFKFSAEVDVRPDFETPKYKGLKLVVEKSRELGEDVEKQLEELRARFSNLSVVERAAKDEDVVILDITGTKDGVQVNEYSGQALAKADDDFAKMASEFDTLDELKKNLEEKVKESRIIEQTYLARDKASEALIELMAKVPLPENAIEAEFEEHFKDGHGDDAHKEEFKKGSRKSMQSQFILDKIAEEENIGVSDADLSEWITQNSMKYQMAPQTFADALVRSGEITLVMGEIRRSKALTLVVKEADVTDTAGQKVDVASVLKEFVPETE